MAWKGKRGEVWESDGERRRTRRGRRVKNE